MNLEKEDFIVDEAAKLRCTDLINGNLYTVVGHGNRCYLRFVRLTQSRIGQFTVCFEYAYGEDIYIHNQETNEIHFTEFSTFYQVTPIKECLIQF